jgi:hypothetical protein
VYYESVDGTLKQSELVTSFDQDRHGTATYLILRYFF